MKKTNLNYSPKDIPAHSKKAYFIKLFEMTNSFLNKNRQAAYSYDKKNQDVKNNVIDATNDLINTKIYILQKDPDNNLVIFLFLKMICSSYVKV